MIARVTILLSASLVALGPQVTVAQDARSPAAALSELDSFTKSFTELKLALTGLQKKIDETTAIIAQNTNPIYPRQQADALKATIGQLLSSVVDNGPLTIAGELALTHVRERLAAIQRSNHFSHDQRNQLTREWNRVVLRTSSAVTELGKARTEFLELLRVLQTNDDFLFALEELRIADQTVDAIQRLTNELRDASVRLRDLSVRIQASGV